jgi:hypothetical protein
MTKTKNQNTFHSQVSWKRNALDVVGGLAMEWYQGLPQRMREMKGCEWKMVTIKVKDAGWDEKEAAIHESVTASCSTAKDMAGEYVCRNGSESNPTRNCT